MSAAVVVAVVVAGIFVLAGIVQAVSGFGSALVAVPLVTVVMDPGRAVVLSVLVGLVLSTVAAVREREHVERAVGLRLMGWAIPALPLGLWVLQFASEEAVSVLVGAVVVLAALLLSVGFRLPDRPLAQGIAGACSGALLTSTGLNGPPLVLALAGRDLPPRRVRATLQAVFAAQDALGVVGFIALGLLSPELLPYAVVGVVGIQAGWSLGGLAFHRFSQAAFDRTVGVVLFASGITAVLGALV